MIRKFIIVVITIVTVGSVLCFATNFPIPSPINNLPITKAQKQVMTMQTIYKQDDNDSGGRKLCKCAYTQPDGSVIRKDCVCADKNGIEVNGKNIDPNAPVANDQSAGTTHPCNNNGGCNKRRYLGYKIRNSKQPLGYKIRR